MQKVTQFIKAKYQWIIAGILLLLLVMGLLYWWKKKDETTVKIVDDNGNPINVSEEQLQTATALATRIYDDLNSGWMFGYNAFGIVGRNLEAYQQLAQSSDNIFTLTYQAYKNKYNSSLIGDIRNESSLAGGTHVNDILAVAARLNLS